MTANHEQLAPLDPACLPPGIASRFVDVATGLRVHILEGGTERSRPLVVLLHGFPELAFSWRKVMPQLVAAGYHVVAPDQRGYGRTTGWDGRYDGDLRSFEPLRLAADVLALVQALGRDHVHCLVSHDFGAVIAPWCALTRPDVFRSLVIMSAPFAGPPALGESRCGDGDLQAALAALDPPRSHYQWYYSTPDADRDMREALGGLRAFLRAYYHMKSADWPGNVPAPLPGRTADALATLPRYYVMDAGCGMAETVAPHCPSPDVVARCRWLPDDELDIYAAEYARTGFQGGLNWYRCRTEPGHLVELELFAGRTVDVPTLYLAGAADWGTFQSPGAFERMESACTRLVGRQLLPGAGHWVQQEQPDAVADALLRFMAEFAPRDHHGT